MEDVAPWFSGWGSCCLDSQECEGSLFRGSPHTKAKVSPSNFAGFIFLLSNNNGVWGCVFSGRSLNSVTFLRCSDELELRMRQIETETKTER